MEQVIQEIATQLGIAASEVEGHVAELFPLVASAMAARSIGAGVVMLLVLVLAVIAMHVLLDMWSEDSNEGFEETVSFFIIGSFVVFCATLVVLLISTPDMIAYIVEPEGAAILNLIEMLRE